MYIPWYDDAAAQFLSGVAISLADRSFSGNAKRYTKERLEMKLDQVTALQYLTDAQNLPGIKEIETGREYHGAIMKAREYFMAKGSDCKSYHGNFIGLVERLYDKMRSYKSIEKVNNLPMESKIAFAFGAEFIGDLAVGLSQVTMGMGNGLTALGKSLYQAPAMYLGLQTGRLILSTKDLFRSKEEKDLDTLASDLTNDGKLLGIVRNYSPVMSMDSEKAAIDVDVDSLEDKVHSAGAILAEGAQKLNAVAGFGIAAIRARIQQRISQKKEAEEKRKKDLSSRYDKY